MKSGGKKQPVLQIGREQTGLADMVGTHETANVVAREQTGLQTIGCAILPSRGGVASHLNLDPRITPLIYRTHNSAAIAREITTHEGGLRLVIASVQLYDFKTIR